MALIQVGLVDTTGVLDAEFVQAVAAALNVQVTRDLPQYWNVQATVRYLPNPKRIPAGVWPVWLVKSLPPGEGGFHLDQHNQPYAEVIATSASEDWSIDASHETIEMLVDPYGNRLQSAPAIGISGGQIGDTSGEFGYLVEACDPCEANDYAYPVEGIAVSDFLTPHFYDSVTTPGVRYSFTGAIKAPREILPGGYITWVNAEIDEVQQIQYVDPNSPPKLINLGKVPKKGLSLREWIDGHTTSITAKYRKSNTTLMGKCKMHRAHLTAVAEARAKLYRGS